MKIAAISDLHGFLPDIPPCDLVLISGDICPDGRWEYQRYWLDVTFRPWLSRIEAPVVACAGNHDWVFFNAPHQIRSMKLPMHYLFDSSVIINGLKIYGTPWQKEFHGWAFNLTENKLIEKWRNIPNDTDLLICHSPPYGVGDMVLGHGPQGSPGLRERIIDVKPKLVVFGHIHPGRGIYQLDETTLINASVVTDKRDRLLPVMTWTLEQDKE